MKTRHLAVLSTALLTAGCNPLMTAELLSAMSANQKETERFELRNEVDNFYISADHHNYQAVEEYSWVNRGETASIEGAARPSCPNDITIEMRDAEDRPVFRNTFHAPHCWKDKPEHWDPMLSGNGTPGTWRITMTYDITGVKDMWFNISRVGEVLVYGEVEERVDGQGHDGDHGDHGCQVVRWNAVSTRNRNASESYAFKCCGPTAIVALDWAAIDDGSMEITIKDDWGAVVYHSVLQRGTHPPAEAETSHGHPGTWTVTLSAKAFSSRGVSIYVEG